MTSQQSGQVSDLTALMCCCLAVKMCVDVPGFCSSANGADGSIDDWFLVFSPCVSDTPLTCLLRACKMN